jgi:hypothetical protein
LDQDLTVHSPQLNRIKAENGRSNFLEEELSSLSVGSHSFFSTNVYLATGANSSLLSLYINS